jgi:hypothetical protein
MKLQRHGQMARVLDFDRGVGRWNQNTEMSPFDLDHPGRAPLVV